MASENNKRIAKNTILLYIRMFFSIIVGLYTSRVVLSTLGVDDYGVYNVVGGVVAMLGFLNSAMTAASQRFISFELGTGNKERLKEVFSTSVLIHVIIALIILVLAETIGLWFLNHKINISADRMVAANWVYQCAILSFMLTVVSVPYNASIVAHEHMKAFAYISILDVFLKLLIVYVLVVIPFDKLISYAILLLSVALVIRLIYGRYCALHFGECRFRLSWNKRLFKEMFSFAGWSIIGNLGFAIKDQGSNIVLNLFYGVSLNAARGIALQVNGVVSNFYQSFIMAINPQITKQYAAGNVKESVNLVYAGCRFSFFLISLISIPIMINMDYLLSLWLGNVPDYTSQFLFYALWAAVINSMAGPLVTAMQATGRIMLFQIVICLVMMCEMPLSYLVLSLGYKPYYIMFASILVVFVGLFVRFLLLKRLVPDYSLIYFTLNIVAKNLLIILGCYAFSAFAKGYFDDNFMNLVLTSFVSFMMTLLIIYGFGIRKQERAFINAKILAFYHRFFICQ